MRRPARAWIALLVMACAAGTWTADSLADPPIGAEAPTEQASEADRDDAPARRGPAAFGTAQRKRAAQAAWPQTGHATYYHDGMQGRRTSSGERYDRNALTAAHRTLPLGTLVRVTNLFNLRSVLVRVNDRGPFARGRSIDLSRAAATTLGYVAQGSAAVAIEVVARPAMEVPGASDARPGETLY